MYRCRERAMSHENSYNRSNGCSIEPSFVGQPLALASFPSKPSIRPTTNVKIDAAKRWPNRKSPVARYAIKFVITVN